jgi:hypothetical protein
VAVNMLAYVNKIWPQDTLVEASLADRPYTVFYAHTHMYKYEQRLGYKWGQSKSCRAKAISFYSDLIHSIVCWYLSRG